MSRPALQNNGGQALDLLTIAMKTRSESIGMGGRIGPEYACIQMILLSCHAFGQTVELASGMTNMELSTYLLWMSTWRPSSSLIQTGSFSLRWVIEKKKNRNLPGLQIMFKISSKNLILEVLREADGKQIPGCKEKGITRSTLYGKLRRHGIMVPSNH